MTITFPLDFPEQGVQSITFNAVDVVGQNNSPFTMDTQTYDWQADKFHWSVTLPIMTPEQGKEFAGFLLSLRGRAGSFLLGDPMGATPRGAMSGTPVVDGGGQTGLTLAIRGATPSITGWGKRGDYIQLGTGDATRLHFLTADADTDVSGDVTLDIWPRLRTSPADGATLITTNCKGRFKLKDNLRSWSVDQSLIYNSQILIEEDLR